MSSKLSKAQFWGFISAITQFDVMIVMFMAGIAVYFSLGFEPNSTLIWAMFFASGGLAATKYAARRAMPSFLSVIIMAAMFSALGFAIAASHTKSIGTEFLPDYPRAYTVSGWIEGQDRGRTGPRYMIRVQSVNGEPATMKRLRVRASAGGDIGSFITVRAVMTTPPLPAVPGGYNSRRASYFKGLGGSGYAVTPFQPSAPTVLKRGERVERQVTMFRYRLAQRIKRESPVSTAGLQAALMTGLRQDISRDQVEALRASGLAHILAISGLHMALLAGSFYSLISFLLASLPPFAQGRDVRKFAAFAGICVATLYLIISGASVATQRAYIMTMILFLAVILNRQALSTRSVSLAALITLLLNPQSLLSVGFQMSFAAVLALVIVYRHWADWQAERGWVKQSGLLMGLRNGIISLSVTSLVAGFATGLFAIIHFQRWAKYGLLGNLAAMPIFTFLVMPMALAAFLLLPFGLERLPLWVMGMGLEQVLWVADHIYGLTESMLSVKRPPDGFVALYAICFLLICLGRWGLKIGGGLGALILAFIWLNTPLAVMRISDDGRVTWQSDEGTYFTLNRRADRFGREQFLRGNGEPDASVLSTKYLEGCDQAGCDLSLRGQKISIIETPDLIFEACEGANLVIVKKRAVGPRARYLCKADIIDPKELAVAGGIDLYITSTGISRKTVKRRYARGRDKRAWQ